MKKAFIFSVCIILTVFLSHVTAQTAKDFTIYYYDAQQEWTLYDHIGKHVICLISGSFC